MDVTALAWQAADRFVPRGAVLDVVPHGSGHIHASFRVRCATGAQYLLQRINTGIFRNVHGLMGNVERVTRHLAGKAAANGESSSSRVLTLVPALDGTSWHTAPDGSCWRMFHFIAGAHSFDAIETPEQAYRAAAAFGDFQRQLQDLPLPRLYETIPAFHETPRRFRAFRQAVAADPANRAATCHDEIDLLLGREPFASVLLHAGLPERVTHNDTKLNNVLFDDTTDQALCVVDLDTVMPGLSLYDFGDMVRTATSSTAEDEADLSKVDMQLPYFDALVRGYLSTAGGFLLPDERQLLPLAGNLITLEQAVRFLDDYLRGDIYYRVQYPTQNLLRCRTQLRLLQSMEKHAKAIHAAVEAAVNSPAVQTRAAV